MAKRRGNKEGSIYRLKSGTWRAQVSQEGKRISFTAPTQQECQEWVRTTLQQFDNGLSLAALSQTIDEFMSTWLAGTRLTLRESTYEQYAGAVSRHIIPYVGKLTLREFRPIHVQKLYEKLAEKEVGVYAIRKVHSVLHAAFAHAVRLGIVPNNPVTPVRQPKKPERELTILDQFQANQFLVTASNHRWLALFHLAITTGMRQMELLGLKWTDVDWVRKSLKVERQLLRKPDRDNLYITTKTRSGRRSIALGSQSLQILRAHYNQQQLEMRAAGNQWVDHGLVFTTSIGTPIHYRNLVREFKMLLNKAGLPDVRFHDLRHTAASLMLNQGVPPIVASKRLGHARVSITLDIYGHLMPDMQEDAAQIMDDLITPIQLHTIAHD
jgi:integrase